MSRHPNIPKPSQTITFPKRRHPFPASVVQNNTNTIRLAQHTVVATAPNGAAARSLAFTGAMVFVWMLIFWGKPTDRQKRANGERTAKRPRCCPSFREASGPSEGFSSSVGRLNRHIRSREGDWHR